MRFLIVLTGPSHAGKTRVARSLLALLDRSSAHVSIDDIVADAGPPQLDQWEAQLPAAYDTAIERTGGLLRSGSSVVFESTFTYVPLDQRPAQFHADQLARLERLARLSEASFAVVRLRAELPELLARQAATGRVSAEVVEGTWREHCHAYAGPRPVVEVATDHVEPAEAANRILEAVGCVQAPAATT